MPVSKKHAAIVDDLVKRQSKKGVSPATLLMIAKAVVAVLELLGYDLPDILDVLKAKGLPTPPNVKPAK